MLGDELRALDDVGEVPLRQSLALGDHAEAVRACRLGRPRVLEDLLRAHHRVHRGVRVRVLRLCAEAAVLRTAAGLGVDQRAEVGGLAEAFHARLERAVDEGEDLVVVLDLPEGQRFLVRDQRRQAEPPIAASVLAKVWGRSDG